MRPFIELFFNMLTEKSVYLTKLKKNEITKQFFYFEKCVSQGSTNPARCHQLHVIFLSEICENSSQGQKSRSNVIKM